MNFTSDRTVFIETPSSLCAWLPPILPADDKDITKIKLTQSRFDQIDEKVIEM